MSEQAQPEEIRIKLQPKQKEAFIKSMKTPVLFYGGAKGGGKSFLVRAKEITRRLKNKNTKGLIIRKTFPELRSNHIQKLFQEYPAIVNWYNKSEKTIYYPNGSTTEFSYLQSTDDVYTYQGREYDDISIDEITQHEEPVFKILRSSLRTTTKGLMPTILLTGNPGGPGHTWVKRIFIDKQFKPEEQPSDYSFIQARVQDNLALMDNDPDYVKRLYDLPDHLRRAYLEGDWNIFAGMAFDQLSHATHIIEPFPLPKGTRYFAGYDHGYNHPFSLVMFALHPDGTIYVIKHFTGRLMDVPDISHGMEGYIADISLSIYAGLDIWSRGRDGSPTIYDQFIAAFRAMGIASRVTLIEAHTDRKQGVAEIRKYINYRSSPNGKPRLYFFRNCTDVFDTVAGMQFSAREPEDVLKVDADGDGKGGDDAYDAFRYGLMGVVYGASDQKTKDPAYNTGEYLLKTLEEQANNDEEGVYY